MIFNLRDGVSALLLLPLCFGGAMLTMFFVGLIEAVRSTSPAPDAPSSYAPSEASTGGMIFVSLITLVIAVAIPAAYFFFYKKLRSRDPKMRVFGGLSLDTAFVLGLIAYIGPAIGIGIIIVAFS